MTVNRRDIFLLRFHYKRRKRFLIQRFDAELPRLFQFAAGLGARDHVVVFLLTGRHLAPSCSSAAVACSRDIDASVPVRTNVFPASGPGSRSAPAPGSRS